MLLALAARGALQRRDTVFADPACVRARAATLPWGEPGWRALEPFLHAACVAGLTQSDALAGAVDHVLAHPGCALVTGPIDKARARAEGFAYAGHTDYLAARTNRDVVMMLAGPIMKVALATVHLPLRDVAPAISEQLIVRTGEIVLHALANIFACLQPRLSVWGLNPHAGERGLLGDEEQRVIAPAVATLQARFPHACIEGPIPADSGAYAHAQGESDAVLAMYHDQGLAPFKLLHFRDGVNVTLGLPFVRTSPDHGTARALAGTGAVDPTSMVAACELARAAARPQHKLPHQ